MFVYIARFSNLLLVLLLYIVTNSSCYDHIITKKEMVCEWIDKERKKESKRESIHFESALSDCLTDKIN